jgi:DNA-binding IclR family transcriptional regulator
VGEWSFLTNHARVLACIAEDPGVRIRDIAAALGITERNAHSIVTDLTTACYVVKKKEGRRNRYRIQVHVPLRRDTDRHQTIGELLAVLVDTKARADLQQGVDVTA